MWQGIIPTSRVWTEGDIIECRAVTKSSHTWNALVIGTNSNSPICTQHIKVDTAAHNTNIRYVYVVEVEHTSASYDICLAHFIVMEPSVPIEHSIPVEWNERISFIHSDSLCPF